MTVKKWKHSGTKKHSMSDREIRNGLLSEKAAEEGIVLLKNDKKILPLNISTKIGLYGAGAGKTVKGGTGSGDVNNRSNISIYQGLKMLFGSRNVVVHLTLVVKIQCLNILVVEVNYTQQKRIII